MLSGSRWLGITGFLFLSLILIIIAFVFMSGIYSKLTRIEAVLHGHSVKLDTLELPISAADELSGNLEYLNTRVHMLTSVVTELEVTLTNLRGLADSIAYHEPGLTADTTRSGVVATAGEPRSKTSVPAVTSGADAELPVEHQQTPPGKSEPLPAKPAQEIVLAPAAAKSTDRGSWVINLASLGNQAAADQFITRVQSHGIDVEQQIVTVKGQRRWRIRVTGFASANEARINAGPIQEKLGLKNSWISAY